MWVSTFHSACVRILRRDADQLGFPSSFTIYDQADAVRLTGYVLRDLNLDPKRFPPRSVHATISRGQERRHRRRAVRRAGAGHLRAQDRRRLRRVPGPPAARPAPWTSTTCCSVTVELFRTHPEVLEHYRRRFRHVLVDEYQDTNTVQNELVLLLAGEHRNVCVVGDSDQCLPAGHADLHAAGAGPDRGRRGRRPGAGRRRGRPSAAGDGHRRACRAATTGRSTASMAGEQQLRGTPAPPRARPVRRSIRASHVVYLMQRADRGFRVGRTMSVRADSAG